jgi:CRP-like cAMP-binding protein
MSYNKKIKSLEQYPLTFGEATIFRKYKKGEIILPKGYIENFVSYIHRGIIGMFLEKDGEDICYGLAFEQNYISAYDSFLQQIPSQMTVIALEETVLASISYEKLQAIINSSMEGQIFGRQIAENLFLKTQQRIVSFLTQSAEERYIELESQRPEIFKRVKQKYIASYLGITPISLSRIRNKITP